MILRDPDGLLVEDYRLELAEIEERARCRFDLWTMHATNPVHDFDRRRSVRLRAFENDLELRLLWLDEKYPPPDGCCVRCGLAIAGGAGTLCLECAGPL